ncbi:MAG: HD domain-containing protein [Desulfobacteraceae bacterium]|nr:HD domain-containing protein [Desulfobacteraceae bacterium]
MQKPDWTKFIQNLFSNAEPYLARRNDLTHTRMVHNFARILLKREGGNPQIVEPAAILHDVGWSQLTLEEIQKAYGVNAHGDLANRLNRRHEAAGAAIAEKVLKRFDYDPDLTGRIVDIIRRHDSGRSCDGLEERIVKDADKLWRFSRLGARHEIRRQQISLPDLYKHLAGYNRDVFFTPSALRMAVKRLARIAQQCTGDTH